MDVIAWLLVVWFSITGSFAEPEAPAEPPVPSATDRPQQAPFPVGLVVEDTDGAIEQRFLTRTPLPTCGLVEVTEHDLWGDVDPSYDADCLQRALDAGRGAESVVLMHSGAGQVLAYYRLNPDGPLEIMADRRGDARAERGWAYRVCDPAPDLAETPCAD